ncbi:GIN domain-containing protein [Flavobacterium sp. W20_MBD1_R3]|uniref:GIN domain-containing protein n=1 Tax=Flavobacterium sp. W20_MBD1_R3 TaxID=3240278 RepID=UPI003F8E935C
MKQYTLIFLLLLSTTLTLAQKKEKIKGSKTVTVERREIENFESLLVEDNLEIHLERGEKTALKIEADDNLHEIISVDVTDNILRIYTTKQAIKYKKMIVRVTYTNDLNLITAKDESTVNAIQELILNTVTLKSHDDSKLFLNISTKDFLLQADDKTKTELNLKAENTVIELSKNATLKALITTADLKMDMYLKSGATLEGNAVNTALRLDNNASFTGNKFNTKNADITTESDSSCSLFVETAVSIDAVDKSEIQLLGSPKIEIRKFADEAKLIKKLK